MKKILILGYAFFAIFPAFAQINVHYAIDAQSGHYAISPLVYGNNYSSLSKLGTGENYAFTRIGGNRTTGYNWETNASNAGDDWHHSSDNYLCTQANNPDCDVPGSVYTSIIDDALAKQIRPLATIQMGHFVAADKDGEVGKDNPLWRWKKLEFVKGRSFTLMPDTTDNVVYSDEFVNFLSHKYGKGKVFYALDNEPDLWSHTHPRIFKEKVTCQDLMKRTVNLSKAIKAVDEEAMIFGFVSYGFNGFYNLQGAPDWKEYKSNYRWFIDFYLDHIQKESDAAGRRLVDVLALNWYPEAYGDNRIVGKAANSVADQKARLQAPRSLWDSAFVENSWIARSHPDFLPLLPAVQKSIDTYNPGTKLAITEFQYGGFNDITGTIALTDVLGIFGKYGVYASSHWGTPGKFGSLAYKIFRNYDGQNSTFGDEGIEATMSDKANSSVFASVKNNGNELHVVVLNKNMEQIIQGDFSLNNTENYRVAQVFVAKGNTAKIERLDDVVISGKSFTYDLAPLSVHHFVFVK